MRELKFRGWDGVRYHYLFVINSETGEIIYNGEIKKDWILKQYTGLKDKNGVEIYEGDIVKYAIALDDYPSLEKNVVEWDTRGACFVLSRYSAEWYFWDKMEVIGNIHENPELMEKI